MRFLDEMQKRIKVILFTFSASISSLVPAPVCLMSATVTSPELRNLTSLFDLSPRPLLLANSPVQPHIKTSFIPRPPNAFGVSGIEGDDGQVTKPGLVQILGRLYFVPGVNISAHWEYRCSFIQGQLLGHLWGNVRIFCRNIHPCPDHVFADLEAGKVPKRAIIYFRGLEKLGAVAAYLRTKTGQRSAKDAFFVCIHSELRPPTEKG